jgi:hypothetical protein
MSCDFRQKISQEEPLGRPKHRWKNKTDNDVFVTFCFQWQSRLRVHLVYLTYRWFLAILFVATLILSICDPGRSTKNSGLLYISKWPIYLTNWGYAVCTTQAVLGAWLLTHRLIAERKPGECRSGSAAVNNRSSAVNRNTSPDIYIIFQ